MTLRQSFCASLLVYVSVTSLSGCGGTTVDAAGCIHSDLARGFVRAEVVASEDLLALGSMAEVKKAGRFRLEGKEAVVRDGEVVHIRSAV